MLYQPERANDKCQYFALAPAVAAWNMPVTESSGLALGDGYLFVSSRNGVTAIALVPERSTLVLAIVSMVALFSRRKRAN
jgi:hypothetical protein